MCNGRRCSDTGVYICFMSVFPTVSNLTMDTMLIKHGLKVSDAGRGELTSAMEGQTLISASPFCCMCFQAS